VKGLSFCRKYSALMIFLLSILWPACGPVISKNLRTQADLNLTFQEVFQNPEAYKGKIVIWGGEIVQTINQNEETTLIEISERSLSWQEEPKESSPSIGKFLVLVEKHLDPFIYQKGKEITVAGKIIGEKTQRSGEKEYRYPFLLAKQIFLWRENYPYYYDPYFPWWFYDPLWPDYPWENLD
jgi:outer membrane lipoprotein